jgi:succinate dehydrogenase / fumarate reductase flavoprotein subunit
VVPDVTVTHKDQIPMRPDLLEAFEIGELEKYYTDEELADHPGRRG